MSNNKNKSHNVNRWTTVNTTTNLIVTVLTVVHLFTLYSHTMGMSNLEKKNHTILCLWFRAS